MVFHCSIPKGPRQEQKSSRHPWRHVIWPALLLSFTIQLTWEPGIIENKNNALVTHILFSKSAKRVAEWKNTPRVSHQSHLHSFSTVFFFYFLITEPCHSNRYQLGQWKDIPCCSSHLQQKPSQRQPSNGLTAGEWRSTYLLQDQA